MPATEQIKPRSTVVRTKTHKPAHVQSAITLRRANGQSKLRIAKELGIARNTVTSILELNNVEQQIAQYRADAMELVPLAITAVETDLQLPGNGSLGLRVLESTGVLGDDAIDAVRRNSHRQAGAINVLVQPGATVTLAPSNNDASSRPAVNNCANNSNDKVITTNPTVTGNKQVTVTAGHPVRPRRGKQPRDGVGR